MTIKYSDEGLLIKNRNKNKWIILWNSPQKYNKLINLWINKNNNWKLT